VKFLTISIQNANLARAEARAAVNFLASILFVLLVLALAWFCCLAVNAASRVTQARGGQTSAMGAPS